MTMDACSCGSVEQTEVLLTDETPETYCTTSPVTRLQKLIEDCTIEINRIQLHSELEKKEMRREIDVKTERVKELEKKICKLRTVTQLQADYIKKNRNVLYTEADMAQRIAEVKGHYQMQVDCARQKMHERLVGEVEKRDAAVRKKYTERVRQYQLKVKELEAKTGQVALPGAHTETTGESTDSLKSPSQEDVHLQRGSLSSHPYFPLGMSSKLRRSLTDLGRSPALFSEVELRAARSARNLTQQPAHSALRNSSGHLESEVELRAAHSARNLTQQPAHSTLRNSSGHLESEVELRAAHSARNLTQQPAHSALRNRSGHLDSEDTFKGAEISSEPRDRPPTPLSSPPTSEHGVATSRPSRRKVNFVDEVGLY